jgi:hypothetical protein
VDAAVYSQFQAKQRETQWQCHSRRVLSSRQLLWSWSRKQNLRRRLEVSMDYEFKGQVTDYIMWKQNSHKIVKHFVCWFYYQPNIHWQCDWYNVIIVKINTPAHSSWWVKSEKSFGFCGDERQSVRLHVTVRRVYVIAAEVIRQILLRCQDVNQKH